MGGVNIKNMCYSFLEFEFINKVKLEFTLPLLVNLLLLNLYEFKTPIIQIL